MRILDSKNARDKEIVASAPKLADYLNDASKAHYDALTEALSKANISFVADPLLVRGLDYYCHTAFEFITDQLGAQGTVLGGGRYDGLSEMLGGPHLPSVGFAAGVERLALLIDQPDLPASDVIMVVMDGELAADGFALASTLRKSGLSVDMPYSGNISKKMKRADKIGASYAVMLGSQEFATGELQVKSMATGTSEVIKINDLTSYLHQQLKD